MKKLTNKKGFTLVELLVVVAIIAILMLIAIPRFMDSTTGAKIKTFEGNFRTVVSAITQYSANNGGSISGVEADPTVTSLIASIHNSTDPKKSKPANATYVLTKDSDFTATLPASELGSASGGGDYKIVYSLAGATTGTITQDKAPKGAANLGN